MNDELTSAAAEYHDAKYRELKEERRQQGLGQLWYGTDVIDAFVAGAAWAAQKSLDAIKGVPTPKEK